MPVVANWKKNGNLYLKVPFGKMDTPELLESFRQVMGMTGCVSAAICISPAFYFLVWSV